LGREKIGGQEIRTIEGIGGEGILRIFGICVGTGEERIVTILGIC
jgi:hypothetical protein